MATVNAITQDNLPLRVSQEYAYRILLLEEIKRKSDETRVADVIVVSTEPVYSDLDTAMGLVDRAKPYASFLPPPNFFDLRRNPFTTFSICPSFGSLEQRSQYEQTVAETSCQTSQEEAEKGTLLNCLGTMNKINGWIGYVSSRMGQFLQG